MPPKDLITMRTNSAEFTRWMNGVAREQVPFATAQALTMTAKDAQVDLRNKAAEDLTLRNAHTKRGIRIQRANKRDGLYRMNAQVGSIDWYFADQADEGESTRKPQQARYRYIPVKARKNKARRIPKRMTPAALASAKNVFWQDQDDGTALVYRRKGRGGSKLELLYVAVPIQKVKPAFSLADTVRGTAQRKMRRNFIRSMQKAIRTAR